MTSIATFQYISQRVRTTRGLPTMAGVHPDNPQLATGTPGRETFRLSVKTVAVILLFIVFVVLAELLLRFAAPLEAPPTSDISSSSNIYTAEELRRDLPRYTERQGRDCIEFRNGFNWDPRFGFAAKKL